MGPCSTGFFPYVSVLGTRLYHRTSWRVVRGYIWLQWFFFFLKTLSVHLPISWWVIYKCTCPHHAYYSAVFDQNRHDPHVPPSLFTQSYPKWLFVCFPGLKKYSKGYILPMWKRWNKKNGRSTKRHQKQRVQKLFWAVEKSLDRCIESNGEYLEDAWCLNM